MKGFIKDSTLQGVADSIRLANGDVMMTTKYKPSEMASAILTGCDKKYSEGVIEGYQRGKAEGEQIGWQNGYTQGNNEGYEQGRTNGYNDGHEEGYAEGYDVCKTEKERLIALMLCGLYSDFDTQYQFEIVDNQITNIREYAFFNSSVTKAQFDRLQFVSMRCFYNCQKLTTLILPSVTSIYSTPFNGCSKLQHVEFKKNSITSTTNSIVLSSSSLLSDESIQNIIDALADLTGATSQKVTFHSTVTDKLTEEQVQQITDKNWTLG